MKTYFLLILMALSCATQAQISALILDQESERPIPLVNIQSKDNRHGTTANQKGKFEFNTSQGDTLVFSAIGYRSRSMAVKDISKLIYLQPISYAIPEVAIKNQTKEAEIGRVKKQIFSYGSSALKAYPYMIGRYFEYDSSFNKYPYIKSIEVLTDSDIDSSLFNVRVYSADSLGFPSEPLLHKNLLTYAIKGYNFTQINIEKEYIEFPRSGLFIAVEWLVIEANEYILSYKDNRTKKRVEEIYLAPKFALENNPKRGDGYTYHNGVWHKEKSEINRVLQMKIVLRN